MEITGRVTGDAEVRETRNGKKVTGFNIAINRSYKKGDERIEVTTYIECSYWINSAIAEYLRKGTVVQFTGDLGTNAWVDKDGDAQARITCNVQTIKILAWPANTGESGKPASEFMLGKKNGKGGQNAKLKVTTDNVPDEDDLPF